MLFRAADSTDKLVEYLQLFVAREKCPYDADCIEISLRAVQAWRCAALPHQNTSRKYVRVLRTIQRSTPPSRKHIPHIKALGISGRASGLLTRGSVSALVVDHVDIQGALVVPIGLAEDCEGILHEQ